MNLNRLLIPSALVFAALAGCGDSGQAQVDSQVKAPPVSVDEKPAPRPKADLATLEKSSAAAREALAKNPKDKALLKLTADTIYQEAEAAMYADELPPKEKYPRALKLYEEVVKLDPENKMAKESIDTIVSIYKSMGREVPKA